MRHGPIPRVDRDGPSAAGRWRTAAAALALGTAVICALAGGEALAQQSKGSQGFINPFTTSRDDRVFGTAKSGRIAGPVRKGDKATPLYLNADELEYDTRNNRVIARGSVEIYYADNILTADRVVYDQNSNTLTAEGNARLKQPDGAIVYAERLVTTADFAEAFVQTLSVVGQDDTRIVAVRAIRRDGQVTEFESGKFTPCKSEGGMPPLWCIAAARVIHDKQAATVTYQDAQFEVLGVPVFYLPYFQHADPSVKSKSGFLIPEIASDSRLGTNVTVPYHFALNPSYDFLFNPTYFSKYGVLWRGEWRHKVRFGDVTGTYNLKLAGIEQNSSQDINPDLRERWRGSVQSSGNFSLSSWWNFGWDVIGESDRAFRQFYRLDNVLQRDRVNSVYLTGISERNYFGMTMYHVGGLVLNEKLDISTPGYVPLVTTPVAAESSASRVAPVLDYRYVLDNAILGGELKLNANVVSYWQDLSFTDSLGTGRRIDSNTNRVTGSVGWRRTLIDQIGQTYTPFLSLRGDIITTKDTIDPTTRLVLDDQTVTRGVATAGLLYSYPWLLPTATAAHTIEPVAQIIARNNRVEQRRLPDLDARSQVFDDMNLFEDKSSGYDRIDVGVRANYGMQYTFQSYSGGSARLLAGQSYHLTGDNIYRLPGVDADGKYLFSPQTGLERSQSDYVLGLYVSPFSPFRAVAQARFDEQTRSLRRLDTLTSFNYGPFMAQASYAYTAASPALNLLNDQQEILGLVGLRLSENWSIYGQMRYSLDLNKPLQDLIQLRYADDCFVMTASYIETHINDPTRDVRPDRTVMLRFELKYLGEFRYKTNVLDHVFSDNQPTPR